MKPSERGMRYCAQGHVVWRPLTHLRVGVDPSGKPIIDLVCREHRR